LSKRVLDMEKKIAILGLGLIGGSIALGIKKVHNKSEIIGLDSSKSALLLGVERGIIDDFSQDLQTVVAEARVIFLCLPIEQNIRVLEELAGLNLQRHVLITDVGSTKKKIMDCAEQLFRKSTTRFLGGHPMAGSHKSGVAFADENLFENAYYVLTPSGSLSDSESIFEIRDLLSGLHAKIMLMDAQEHDLVTSQVSHLPHILASCLVNQSADYSQVHHLVEKLAAGGFRDLTRIAESCESMWRDILLTNKEAIVDRVRDFQKNLSKIKQIILADEKQAIFDFFAKAHEFRKNLPIHKKGAVQPFYDLFVSVPDKVGVISKLTSILEKEKISLTNIRILENRAEINGVLQLSFKDERALVKAKESIAKQTDYRTYEM